MVSVFFNKSMKLKIGDNVHFLLTIIMIFSMPFLISCEFLVSMQYNNYNNDTINTGPILQIFIFIKILSRNKSSLFAVKKSVVEPLNSFYVICYHILAH